jgi:hypothetical protein
MRPFRLAKQGRALDVARVNVNLYQPRAITGRREHIFASNPSEDPMHGGLELFQRLNQEVSGIRERFIEVGCAVADADIYHHVGPKTERSHVPQAVGQARAAHRPRAADLVAQDA